MRVLTFDEFVKLPNGTVFSYWNPSCADGLFIRDSVYFSQGKARDYLELSLEPGIVCMDEEGYEAPRFDANLWERWGMFDYDQLYAVYEDDDVESLIHCLSSRKDDS